jgi:hypothetical protein
MSDQIPLDWFGNLLDTHGCQPDKWPQQAIQRATRLMEQDPAARELLIQAQQLDARLNDFSIPSPREELRQVIHQAIPFADQSLLDSMISWIFPQRRELLWKPLLVTATPLLIGFAIGALAPINPTDETANLQEETIYLAGLESTYDGDREL